MSKMKKYNDLLDLEWDDSVKIIKNRNVSSWAVWRNYEAGGSIKFNIDDVSMFDNPNCVVDELNTDIVFVGLNASNDESVECEYVDKERPWYSFHSKKPKGNDYKFRYAFMELDDSLRKKYWGSYLTDIIKDYQESDSSKVMDEYRIKRKMSEEMKKKTEDRQIVQFERLRQELGILKAKYLIAIGCDAFYLVKRFKEYCKRVYCEDYAVFKICHYAHHIYYEDYSDRFSYEVGRIDKAIG